jgi:acetylornithine deacetylase/succinyl-diaminopimelate desuccinylase-like protein
LVIAAHLDTVFSEETNVKVSREGGVLKGPGIGDNCRGLTVILAVARALSNARITTEGAILFVANVGEEGLGNLKGVRRLFEQELKGRITHFVAVDGAGLDITNRAVGSRRYRVTFKGPGGHSYGAFGLPSPINALGKAIAAISALKVPSEPKTTFNVGKVGGGTSVNSIAHTAWMEVDLRSESAVELKKLDGEFKRAVESGLEENRLRPNEHKITVEIQLIGERPTGEQAANAPIVQAALKADRALGIKSRLTSGSTDSNIPISMNIPAITLDGGGRGWGAHSLDEAFDSAQSHVGTQRALLVALELARVR